MQKQTNYFVPTVTDAIGLSNGISTLVSSTLATLSFLLEVILILIEVNAQIYSQKRNLQTNNCKILQ